MEHPVTTTNLFVYQLPGIVLITSSSPVEKIFSWIFMGFSILIISLALGK